MQRRDRGRHSCRDAQGGAKVEEGGVFLKPYSWVLGKIPSCFMRMVLVLALKRLIMTRGGYSPIMIVEIRCCYHCGRHP